MKSTAFIMRGCAIWSSRLSRTLSSPQLRRGVLASQSTTDLALLARLGLLMRQVPSPDRFHGFIDPPGHFASADEWREFKREMEAIEPRTPDVVAYIMEAAANTRRLERSARRKRDGRE